MKIQQIRNATVLITFAGKKILVDPMLSNKGTLPPFAPSLLGNDVANPLVELPISIDEIIADLDAVFISHLHLDHFDDKAKEVLSKTVKVFVQDATDKSVLAQAGFTNVEVLADTTHFGEITLHRTQAQHGRGEVLKIAGDVCGCVLQHPQEKTLYIIADSVWYQGVQQELDKYQPEVVIINGGDNQFVGSGQVIMGKEDVKRVYDYAPQAQIVVSHMEGVNHNTLTRKELNAFLNEHQLTHRVAVPNDGDTLEY